MQQKAQAEFAIILGLLVIAVAVGVYSYTSVTTPSIQQVALTEEQKSVASYIEDLARDAATETLAELYRNGGYLSMQTPQMGYVDHSSLGRKIAYWQVCGNYKYPEPENNFKKGTLDRIKAIVPDSEMIGGRSATFTKGSSDLSATFYDNKITISLTLPTTLDGVSIPQPYVVDVYTKAGEIFDFARNFARMQADCRMFENNLIVSMMQSYETSTPCWIPVLGNAEREHSFTWGNLRDCMELHVTTSLTKTSVGQELPVTDDGRIADFNYRGWDGHAIEFFYIPDVIDYSNAPEGVKACSGTLDSRLSSKKYSSIRPIFYFGDDDGLDEKEFIAPATLDIEVDTGSWTQYLQGMRAAEYNQQYSVGYPVIIDVKDETIDKNFRFASYVYMDNNAIGSCSAPPVLTGPQAGAESYEERCLSGVHTANVQVFFKGTTTPVTGAEVLYYDCSLGVTDSEGMVHGTVADIWKAALNVKYGGKSFVDCMSPTDLSNKIVYIPRTDVFTVYFKNVNIRKTGSDYSISSISDANKRVAVTMVREGDACSPPDPEIFENSDSGWFYPTRHVPDIPLVEHEVSVLGYDASNSLAGIVDSDSFTPSGNVMYVYAPVMDGFGEADAAGIESLYSRCGLEPISASPLTVNCQ